MQPDALRCASTANGGREEPAGSPSQGGNVRPTRVLYSFPHRIGAGRICYTAWEQAAGASAAGADVHVVAAAVARALPERVNVTTTLARGRVRLPYRLVGQLRAIALHDRIVARMLPKFADEIDIVHTWPLGALETLRTAKRLGIPTVLERPNAHTRFAYEIVQKECDRLGVALPKDHEHAYNEEILGREEAEYGLSDYLLCPSDFVVKTFLDQGVSGSKLVRHTYGFDEAVYYPTTGHRRPDSSGLVVLFVGVAAVRKGLHFALEAWLRSPASRDGTFLIAGEFLPEYAEYLAASLAHPSVHVLGHRTDVPELMRKSDVLILPTIEEGYGLVCAEALGSGCVPLVSDACTEVCRHGENALVHHVGDVDALESHLTSLYENREMLDRLRVGALRTAPEVTWSAAGRRLFDIYREVIDVERGLHQSRSQARSVTAV
jgi:glycosyltransferase involved in cell wall biosynthesis